MSQQARVNSIDAIRGFRSRLIVFAERAQSSLSDCDAEAQKTIMKLRLEAGPRWAKRLRERQDALQHAKSELLRKQSSFAVDSPTCLEQRKAVEAAKRAVDEAQEKVARIKHLVGELERAFTIYKGQVAGLSDLVTRNVPLGLARLDRMTDALEAYRSVNPAPSGETESPIATNGGEEP